MNLFRALAYQADERPDADALVWWHRRRCALSFRDLERRACSVGAHLQARFGVRPGDRVLLLLPVGPDLYTILLALFRIGAPAVLVDPGVGRQAFDRACVRAAPRVVVTALAGLALLARSAALRAIPTRVAVGFRFPGCRTLDVRAPADSAVAAEFEDGHPALLTFTSGTGGMPKAGVRTHGFLEAQEMGLRRELALQPGEIDCLTLPVFGLANLAAGVTSVLADVDLRHPGRANVRRLARRMREAGVQRIAGSPALLARLAATPSAEGLPLRKVFVGGGPVFPRTIRALRSAFPGARVILVYGSSEAEPISVLDADQIGVDEIDRIESGAGLPAGAPSDGVCLRVVAARADGAGEIQVAGPRVVSGYLDGIGDAETKVREEEIVWHRTGDAGRLDPDGTIRLLGRVNARVGDRFPFEVEAVALRDAGVRRAALIEREGAPVLAIEGVPGNAVAGLLRSGAVAHVVRVPEIPMDRRHRAKVDYAALRHRLCPGWIDSAGSG